MSCTLGDRLYLRIIIKTSIMTFIEILSSEFYYLIEAIEHGSSDNEVIDNYKKELYSKTGFNYVD